MWRPAAKHPQIGYYADCENAREMVGAFSVEKIMASLSLKNITKIYPHSGDDAKKAKKKAKKADEQPEEKKVNLKVTEEGVIAVQEFNLEIADKEFIVLVGPSGCGKIGRAHV